MDFSTFSDSRLYERCRQIGAVILKYRNQFLGMLPEVEKRKLYLKYHMHSTVEFAQRLAGVSREMVEQVLSLNEHLKKTPILQEKLQSGEVGWSKLRVVASIATPETEKQWVEKIETLSKPALETYVQEIKKDEAEFFPGEKSKAEKTTETMSFSVSRTTAARIRVYKQQLEKKFKRPLTMEQVMEEFLKLTELPDEKSAQPRQTKKSACVTRHIPAEVMRQLLRRYRGVCGFPNCNKPAEIYHHTERFSLYREHNPDTIVPLCAPHERIAHNSLIEHEDESPENWEIRTEPDKEHPKYAVDQVVQKYRIPATMRP